ncbi:hypothetical protein Tco_1539066 [Tanacetum coccineum]
MSNITDVKSVLTQKGLDIFCHKFSIPKDVHPQLPSPNQTIHEMPTGKIGVYTRFFEYANFRLPLSTFLVNVLRHYCINLSQLLVIAAAKVSHLEILCHVHSIEPTVGLFHYPTKVKVVERERVEGEAKLVNFTIGHVVPLLSVAPTRAESELEASVEKLFDEGGSTEQGDSATDGGHDDACLRILDTAFEDTVAGNVTAERPRRQRKKRRAVTDASAPPPVMTEAVITTNVAIIPFVLAPETGTKVIFLVHASIFHDSDSTGIVRSDAAGSSHIPGKELSMGSRDINFETLREIFVSQWNISIYTLLDDHDGSRKFIDHLAPPVLFSQIREMDYHHLFTKFNVGTARQACLNAEVRMRTEYYMSERKRLESKCEIQADLLKAKDTEIENLKAQLLLKEVEVAEAARLRIQVSVAEATEKIHADEIDVLKQRKVALENEKDSLDGKIVHALETTCSNLRDQVSGYERLKEQIEEFQDAQMNIVNDKVAKLDVDLLWLLTHGLKLAIVKCLNSQEYLLALGAAIIVLLRRGCKMGCQSALFMERKVGVWRMLLLNVAVEADYNSALQRLREVDFPLLSEISSHKNASVEDIMNLLRLEDQVVLGETSLSFALSVTHSRVERIRENVVERRSALIGVWAPLVDPLSAENLVGAADTSDSVPTIVATTTALSTTFDSASSVPPITIEDYEVVGTDGPEDTQGNVVFPHS